MKSSLVLCVLLGIVFSVRAASVPPTVEAVTNTTRPTVTATTVPTTVTGLYNDTTTTPTTVTTRPTVTATTVPTTVTGLYNDTTTTPTTVTMTTRYTTIATTVTTTTATSIPCCSPPSQMTKTTTQTTTPTTTPTPTTQPFPTTQAPLSSPSQLTETTPPPIITPTTQPFPTTQAPLSSPSQFTETTTQPFPTTQAPLSSPSQLTETTTPPMITPTTQPFPTTQAPLSSPSQLTETTPPPMITPTTQPFPTTQAPLSSPSQLTETTTPPIITPTTQPFPTTQAPLSSPSQLTETTPPPIITPTIQPFPTTQAPLSSPSQLTETTPPISTTQAPLSPSQMACPEGWEVFQGRCYYFVNDGMTWPQAQSNCAMLESMLVSVHSAQEYGFLQQLTQNNGNQEAWLGGFYLQDQWLWMDGSWFYNNSLSGESQDSSNPCLMLNSYEAWSNSQCNAGDYSSICVKNSNVPPSMLCPQGWTGFQGRCYYHNYESLSWPDADVNCAGLGASLVSVHSPDEYFFLYKQTAANGYTASWLGGFYLEDQWMWLDGSWFYQGFFTQMSPDVTYPCLSTYNTDGWSNYECNQNFPSFCVKDAVV